MDCVTTHSKLSSECCKHGRYLDDTCMACDAVAEYEREQAAAVVEPDRQRSTWTEINRFINRMEPGESHKFDDGRTVVKLFDGTYVAENGCVTVIGVKGIQATTVLSYTDVSRVAS